MTKRTFNIEEVVPRLTDGRFEEEEAELTNSEIKTQDLPKKPPKGEIPKDIKGAKIIVKGPSYGDIIVKVVKDGEKIDFYNFLITDEENRKVKAKNDVNTIPPYIHAALLKEDWYCTNWGEQYSTNAADYLLTYGAIIKHLEEDEKLPEYISDEKDSEEISLTAIDLYISRIVNNGICNEELREKINTIVSNQNVTPLTAITIHAANMQIGDESEIKEIEDLHKIEDEQYIKIYSRLAKNQENPDIPEICPNILPGYTPDQIEGTIWDKPLNDDGYFSLAYTPIKETHIVNTREFSKNNTKYIQVGVITDSFTFYNKFRKLNENECVAENTKNGFPSIFCAAVLREKGIEIKNIPTPEGNKLSNIYRCLLDTYTKFILNSDELHDQLIIKLVYTLTVFEKTYIGLKLKEDGENTSYAHEDRLDKIKSKVDHPMAKSIKEEKGSL